MKPLVAGLMTAAILAGMLFLGSRPPAGTPAAPPRSGIAWADPPPVEAPVEPVPTPAEDAVRALIRSGDAGDVAGYLGSFTGPIRARLEREVATRGREAFAGDLRRAAGARKGHAVYAAEPDGDLAARVAVETVYPDRNERQTYRVVASDDVWRVAEVATVRSRQPSVPFGASINPTTSEATSPRATPSPKVGLTVEAGDDPEPP